MCYVIPYTLHKKRKRAEWLTIGELARQAQVTKATIHHYVKEGLLPKPVKKNRQMAYYDPASLQRIKLIKELQQKRFLPLSVIRKLLLEQGEESLRMIDQDILQEYGQRRRYTKKELLKLYPVEERVFEELLAHKILTPHQGFFCQEDARILFAVQQMRQAGLNEELGFTPAELSMYVRFCQKLIDEEFALFNTKVLGQVPPEEAARLAKVAIFFSSQLLGAMHYRKLMERLELVGETQKSKIKKRRWR